MNAPDRREAYRRIEAVLRASAMEPNDSGALSGRASATDASEVARDRAAASAATDPVARPARAIDRSAAMARFVTAAWPQLAPTGVSWLGFYVEVPGAPESERLVLAAREPKPACSPIGLHGACGRCLRAGEPLVVRDVAELGANYIACDPRDRSELVIPCIDANGRAWAVLDLDSHEIGAFDSSDATALAVALRLVGLTS